MWLSGEDGYTFWNSLSVGTPSTPVALNNAHTRKSRKPKYHAPDHVRCGRCLWTYKTIEIGALDHHPTAPSALARVYSPKSQPRNWEKPSKYSSNHFISCSRAVFLAFPLQQHNPIHIFEQSLLMSHPIIK